jgi:hypothetical protein
MMCSVAVAVVGLLGALLIYVRADDSDADENVQIVIVDGKAYKIPLASTKMYQRELRRALPCCARDARRAVLR